MPRGTSGTRLYPKIQNIHLFDLMNQRVCATFSTTLKLYYNLSSLHLTRVTIDASLREILTSLSKLEDLGLSDCDMAVSDGFLRLQRLKILSFSDMAGNQEPLQIASPESLRTLDAGNYISRLIPGFGQRGLDQLVDLSLLTVPDADLLFRFFDQCPRLQSLTISQLRNHTTLPAVHPNSIPLLRTLTGPPKLHQLLTPGRPVSSATVLEDEGVQLEHDYLVGVCLDIARSSVPVHSLALLHPTALRLDFLAIVTSLFPEIKELAFAVQGLIRWEIIPGRDGARGANLDQRRPDLSDDAAFDELPADDISDNEDDSQTIIVARAPHQKGYDMKDPGMDVKLQTIFEWIFDSKLKLPRGIEVLRLEVPRNYLGLPSPEQQHQTIAALSALCPLLREVQFGRLEDNWKRSGELWKSNGHEEWIRVVS